MTTIDIDFHPVMGLSHEHCVTKIIEEVERHGLKICRRPDFFFDVYLEDAVQAGDFEPRQSDSLGDALSFKGQKNIWFSFEGTQDGVECTLHFIVKGREDDSVYFVVMEAPLYPFWRDSDDPEYNLGKVLYRIAKNLHELLPAEKTLAFVDNDETPQFSFGTHPEILLEKFE